MNIGILSDTHGYLNPKILDHFKACDQIWHAGDIGDYSIIESLEEICPVKAVYGNIDSHDIRLATLEHNKFNCEGLKIWITHIGGYPPKYTKQMKLMLQADPPDIFVCGHSHILKVIKDPNINNLLSINPGACGTHGFHKMSTIIRFSINAGILSNMQIIELGQRGKL